MQLSGRKSSNGRPKGVAGSPGCEVRVKEEKCLGESRGPGSPDRFHALPGGREGDIHAGV
jgi:hypothetical protein